MKSRIGYAAIVALMMCGMAWSQTDQSSGQGKMDTQTPTATQKSHTDAQGDLPAVKENEGQSGKGTTDTTGERPGAMGTPTTPDAGPTPKGETPGTGSQTEEKGSATGSTDRPGVDPNDSNPGNSSTTPNSSDTSGKHVPSYEKPIATPDSDSSKPSQKGTDMGTESPK
jgi:hypothetical protein